MRRARSLHRPGSQAPLCGEPCRAFGFGEDEMMLLRAARLVAWRASSRLANRPTKGSRLMRKSSLLLMGAVFAIGAATLGLETRLQASPRVQATSAGDTYRQVSL